MHRGSRVVSAILTAATVIAASIHPVGVAVAEETVAPPGTGSIAVGSAADSGPGTLRAAIEEANARPGADTIAVAVGEPIAVSSPLPAITDAVTIDTAVAELRGAGGGAGFTVLADDVAILGFTISGFEKGVVVDRASRVTITRNAITDNSGSGFAIVGPTKEEVAAALSGGTITLEGLTALVPTDVDVRGNTFARNGGPAVAREQEGVVAIDALTRDAATVRGTVRDAAESPSVEIYESASCDAERPQAEVLVGTAPVADDGTFELAVPADTGEITALPSDGLSGTGAISGCAQPAPAASEPTETEPAETEPTAATPTTTPAVPDAPSEPESEAQTSGTPGTSGLLAPAAADCTIKWYGSAGTNSWHDALNWDTGKVPGPTDIVCISDGIYVIYLTGTSTVAKLQVDGSLTVVGGSLGVSNDSWVYELVMAGGTLTAAAEVSVTNTFNWSGGTLTGTGTLRVEAGASGLITDSTAKTLAGHLRNDGNLTWVDGTINLNNTLGKSHLDNYGTLTVSGDDTTDWTAGSCCPVITNRPGASVVKTGTGTATLGDELIDFVNDGTVTVQAGTLWLDVTLAGGVTDITRGTWVVNNDATLKLYAANFVVNSTTIALGGPNAKIVDHADADAFRNFATNAGTLTLHGRSLNLPGSLDNTGTLALDPTSVVKLAGDFSNWSGSRLEYRMAGPVAGDDFGVVNPAGGAYLGGTIEATLIGGFVPDPADKLVVLDSSNLSGTFEAVEGDLYANYDYASDDFYFTLSDPFPNCDAVFTNGGGSGSWHYAPNWDSGYVPSGDDRVCIPSGLDAYYSAGTSTAGSIDGDGELTISGGSLGVMVASSIARLDLQGGTFTGDGEMTVTESFSWTTGTLAGAGTLVVDVDATAGFTGSNSRTLSRHLRNDGALTWADGTIIVRSDLGGVAHLDNYGALTISGDDDMPWWGGITPPTITNRSGASIVKTGSYTATLGNYGSGFVNEGTVDVSQGTLEVNCDTGCGGAGDWNLTGNLEFQAGEWDITGDVSGAGMLTISSDPVRISGSGRYGPVGWTTLDEGVLDVDSTPPLPNTTGGLLMGGDLTGDGDLTVTEMFNWQFGELTGTGTLTVGANVTGYISSASTKTLGRHLRNDGGITWSEGTIQMRTDGDGEAHLDNYGTLNLSGDVTTDWVSGATPPLVTNRPGALLRKSGSWMTTATIGAGAVFSNEGAVRVEQGGTLFIDTTVAQISGTTLTGGKWEVVEGTLEVKDLSVVTNQAEIVEWGCCNLIVDESWNDAVENVITTNQGTLSLHNKGFDTANQFTNSGTIRLDPWSNIDVQDAFVQTSTGRLEVEISGLNANGTIETNSATLAGTLESILVPPDGEEDPYAPVPGDEFIVLWADTLTGTFSPVEGPLGVTYDDESGSVILHASDPNPDCDAVFTNGGGSGSWSDGANWDSGYVPSGDDRVCIPSGLDAYYSAGTSTAGSINGDGELTISGGSLGVMVASSIGRLDLQGGTFGGDGDLTVTESFSWTTGTLAGAGALVVGPDAAANLTGISTKNLGRHLRNDGEVTWADGTIVMRSDLGGVGHLDNYGTLTISGDDDTWWNGGSTPPTITNRQGASIVKTANSTASLGDSTTGFVNDGTITVAEGGLQVRCDTGCGGSGDWNVTGILGFHAGEWDISGDVSGAGSVGIYDVPVRISGTGRFGPVGWTTLSEGILDVDSTPALPNTTGGLVLMGDELTGDGDLTVTEMLTWEAGNLNGSGTLTLAGSAVGNLTTGDWRGLGRHLRNEGQLDWVAGTIQMRTDGDGEAHLDNYGTLNLAGTVSTDWYAGAIPPKITNRPGATILKTGTGTATLGNAGVATVNDGTVRVIGGTLLLGGDLAGLSGTTLTGGEWIIDGFATLRVRNANVVTNAAKIALSGMDASFEDHTGMPVLTYLAVNNGELRLQDWNLAVFDDFTNNGVLSLRSTEFWVVGAFTQSAGGRLEVGVSGPVPNVDYGRVLAYGGATIGGTISGDLLGGYTPGPADTFTVIDAESLTGTFATVEGDFQVSYDVPNGDVILSEGVAGDCTVTWDGGALTTSWHDAANWDGDTLPGSSDVACIPGGSAAWHTAGTTTVKAVAGEGTLVLNGGTFEVTDASEIGTLALGGGTLTGAGDLTVNAGFVWGAGELAGGGELRIGAGAAGTIITNGEVLGRHLVNHGSLVWSEGDIDLSSDGDRDPHLDNYGTFEISGVGKAMSWTAGAEMPRITNRSGATMTSATSDWVTVGEAGKEVAFVNDGTVTVGSSKLVLSGGGASGGSGSWVAAGGNVVFGDGDWELTGAVSGAATVEIWRGTVRLSGAGRVDSLATMVLGGVDAVFDVDSAPVSGNELVQLWVDDGGTLTGDGDVSVTGSLLFSGGEVAGSGRLTIEPGAEGSIVESPTLGRHLVNEGTLKWEDNSADPGGTVSLSSDGDRDPHLDNYGTFEISGVGKAMSWTAGAEMPRITNRSGATMTSATSDWVTVGEAGKEVAFVNDGTVTVGSSKLVLSGGGASGGSGSWVAAGGNVVFRDGTWELTGSISGAETVEVIDGSVRLSGGGRVDSLGWLVVAGLGGVFDVDSTPALGNTLVGLLVDDGGTLTGDGDLSVTGDLSFSGGDLAGAGRLTIEAGASGSLTESATLGRHLVNEGTLRWQDNSADPGGTLSLSSDGDRDPHLDNYGTFEITGVGKSMSWSAGSTAPLITNRPGATIEKNGTGTATLGDSGTVFANGGTVTVEGGTLQIDGELDEVTGTTLTGGGWVVMDGATLQVRDADVVTNNADIALVGLTAEFVDDDGANALRNLAANSGTLSLAGVDLDLSGNLTNVGTLKLDGSDVTLPGDFAQTAAGRLEIPISGPVPGIDYGRIVAAGSAAIDGTLSIITVDPFSPTDGVFTIVDAGSVSGDFATVEGADIGNGSSYQVRIDVPNGDVVLAVGETAHLAFVGDIAISETATDLDVGFELDRPLGVPVQVHYETVAGSATPGDDYTAVSGTVNVPAGETAGSVAVPLHEDDAYEGAESFTVRMTGADAGTNTIVLDDPEALVTILDDEDPILPAVQILPQSAGEAAGSIVVEVKGSGGNTAWTFPFQVFAGTAATPDDYSHLLTPSTVAVPANGSAFVAVPLVSDVIDEDDETFTVDVAGTVGTMTIIDDDLPPVAVIDGLTITEGDDGTVDANLAVRLVDPFLKVLPQESGRIVTVAADTLDGTALAGDDYVAMSGVVVFSPGQTTRTFAVPIVGDEVDEDTEQLAVDLDGGLGANATVADDEGATVTIIDDDGAGNADEIAQQLETGGASLFDGLDEWGDAFDLDQYDGSDPEMFELPGLTDDLASLFEPQDDLGGLDNPFENLSDDLEALCDQVEGLGVTIDWVEGGACGRPAPPTGPDVFQVRYQVTLADLAQALGFSGDELNDDMQGALEGLASALDLDADFTPLSDLVVTLVVGVDEAGFYVSSESGLRLDIGATGTVAGGGTVAGVDGLTIEGTATADLSVSLTADRGPARLRLGDLGGSPLGYLRPSATGTVELGLGATLGPATLDWTGAYTLTVDENLQTTTELISTLEAALTLPGITENGDPAVFTLLGAYEDSTSTWTLTGGGEVASGYALYGFDIEELGLELVLTPDSFGGSASFAMKIDLGGPETPLTLDCDATFDDTALHAECHLALDEATLGASPALVYLGGVTVGSVFDGDVATGSMTGGIDVAADTLVLLPQTAPPGTEPGGAGRAEDVTGSLDSDGNLALHAGLLTGSIGGEIEFEIEGVDFALPPTGPPPGRVFSVGLVEATIPSLDGLGVTLTGFHLNGDGTFGAEGVGVTSQGFLQTIGLAGILPFDITEVEATFPDWEDLDTFLVEVTGHFDFTTLAALPFTPEIGLGGPVVTPSSPPEDNVFTFAIAVDSLSEGEVRPWDLGPITLGFDDLEVGDVTLGAQLTLGGYELGEWVDDFGGTLSIESGLDGIVGDASVDVSGSLDVTPGAAALDLTGTFAVSANLSEDVRVEGASLDFDLGASVDDAWQFTVTGPNLTGAGIDRIEIAFGDFMRLVGTGVDIDFSPAPGDPLIAFGGTPGDGSLAVEFEEEFEALAGWGGEAGNFAIDADLTPRVLPGFFLNVFVPPAERFGLPDWLPLHVEEVGIRFPDVDFENIPEGGIPIADLAAFTIRFSGGIEANETWPISAAVDGLEVDLGKLANLEFPITNLGGFKMGVEPFELVPGFEIGGGLELGTIDVDGDPAPGDQIEEVFYGRIYGQFEYEGLGAGVDLVVSQYGPVLAKVLVPVGIPIDGGLLGGVILSGVEGGLAFGGAAFPDPQTPLDILHDPAFDTDFPVDDDTIRDSVEPAVQNENLTWDNGFTIALSGKLTHAMAPAIVSGDVTIGMNVGLIPGRQGVKFIGSGDISAWGMEFAGAALLIDLTEVLEPTFDFAFETPQPGNPLAFLLPAQATFEASLDTKGVIPGFGLGVATFVERAASGSLEVGQDFFDAGLEALATSLEGDHTRPLARLVLDANGDGRVSGSEDQQAITRDFMTSRSIALMGGGGLPSDPAAAGRAARVFVSDLLTAGSGLAGGFDLSAVFTHADYAAFADLLGAGGEAIAALLGVVRDAVMQAGEAFWSEFDPSFHLHGMLQPIILGIPFGEPQHQVELIISKTGLGFGFDTSIGDISQRICGAVIPYIGGALCQAMALGFEDHLGMTFELPLGGIIEGLFGGSGLPTLDPWSGDWAIELRGGLRWLDFEVGQMTGLVVAAHNPAFVDTHVQKLYENPGAPLDPSRIPIQTEQHYLDIVEYGGVLLTGRLLLPELLTDPVGLLSSLNLQVPDDILDMPDWVAAIADHLSQVVQPAAVQVFMPGFGGVLEADFDAPTEAQRLTPIGSGQSLADAVNDISEAAYIEGVFDGTLLSLPFGRAVVTSGDQKLSVEGELPLTGLETRIDLDVEPMLGTGGMVDMPRAAATVTVDAAKIDDVLAGFGIPPVVRHIGTSTSSFRAISPGYDPSSSDPLLRRGGIELATHLRINGLVDDADFRLVVAPPAGAGLPDVEGHASVDQIGPLGGVTIHDVAVDLLQRDGDFSIGLAGTAEILGASARVHGELNPDLTGELAVDFDSGGPRLAGFGISGGWVLALTRPGGVLTASLSFDGDVVFPSWLSGPGGVGHAHATGSIATDGRVDLALDLTQLSLFGFTLRNGTFHLGGDERRSTLAIDAKLDFLGATLDVDGSLTIGSSGPAGTLALAFASGSSLAFGPVSVKGTLGLKVSLTSAAISVAGTADIPGIANALGISGSISSNGTGSLALTGSSLGVKGFGITRHTTGSPIPPLASITRTSAATTMTVDAKFSFLGSNLDVDGNLSLALAGPTGSLALTYNGSGNIPFSGWTLEGGVTIAVTPSAGSIAVNSKLDIPGLVNNATVTGSLSSSLLGSLSVSVGTISLGAYSLTGTFTLSRTGSPAVTTLSASNVNLAWSGVSTFTVNTFSVGTDGHFDASVQGKTLSISAFTLTLPSFNLHVGAGATGVELQIGQSSLAVSGIGALTIPAVDIDTTGDFSVTLASTHLDLSALDLDGKLIFERQSGVFRLRVTGTTAFNKATVSIPGLATVTVENFTIASDSTFDVAATSSRLGPDALSIRGASIRVKKTGTSASTIKVTATGGKLYLPVGDPITLPYLEIDGDASWSHTFTGTGINLGPALRTYNDPSFTLSLSGGVLRLSLNAALGVTVLAGSVSMELRTFAVASDGTFEGSVRGRLAMLGFTLASATFDVSRSGSAVRLRILSSSPVSVDLGSVSASVYGSVYSDGRFDFSGNAAVDLTLLTVGLKGSATARLRNSGLSGTFTGRACALGVCVDLLSASIGNDGKLRVVIAGVTFYLPLFGAAVVPADTLAPLLSQVADITVTANVGTSGSIGVNYTAPTATDNVDSSPTVTCTPASGAQFGIGTTTVTCTARDDAGNSSSRSFKITVVDDNSVIGLIIGGLGDDLPIIGGGFVPRGTVTGTLFSDPIALGTTKADDEGNIDWTVEIPRSARPGRHHIVCEGEDPSGEPHMLVFPVLIKGREPQGPPTSVPPVTGAAVTTTTTTTAGPGGTALSGNLPFTGGGAEGTVPRALVLMLTGVLFVFAARRRRDADLRN